MSEPIDILENQLLQDEPGLLGVILFDQTTQKNIFWATDSYVDYGKGYGWHDSITVEAITGRHGNIIMPRAMKKRLAGLCSCYPIGDNLWRSPVPNLAL